MDDKELLDVYSDYLISAFGQTTGTGLSELLDGTISHDRIQRFLSQNEFTSGDLWQIVKPQVRAIQQPEGVLIIDDSIAEKPYTDENEIVCWHYDHAQDRQVKGIHCLSALYHVQAVSLPVGFRLVAKTEYYTDQKDGKTKRRSPVSKNEPDQALLRQAKQNPIPFRFVLNAVWYASADNRMFVKPELASDFIMPLKSNRKRALSRADKQQGRYGRLDSLTLEAGVGREIYLQGVDFPLALVKQVFANEEGSSGIHYWVCSQTTLTADPIIDRYRKRGNVEPFHKSLKQNASLEKSPTGTVRTQTNPLFAAFCGYIKLELLTRSTHLNHLALKSRFYLIALHSAFDQLRQLRPVRLSA
jgi:DDE superfamily endonuclease